MRVQLRLLTIFSFPDEIVRMTDSFYTGMIFHEYHYIRISILTDPFTYIHICGNNVFNLKSRLNDLFGAKWLTDFFVRPYLGKR